MSDMTKRNEWLRNAASALSALRAARPADDNTQASMGGFINSNGGPLQSVVHFMNDNKIAVAGGDKIHGDDWHLTQYSQSEIDQSIQNIKTVIDMANSSVQLNQARMQGLMEKRNQACESLSNGLAKLGKTTDTIIGNSR